jgi:membrane-bound lytic murein transglycosylase D
MPEGAVWGQATPRPASAAVGLPDSGAFHSCVLNEADRVLRGCRAILILVTLIRLSGRAQDPLDLNLGVDVDVADLLDQGRKLIEERLDDRVARLIDGFESGDRTQVQTLLAELERDFGGDYVLDLARWRRVVAALVPILEEEATTAPYGAWLRSRMDYFEVASELAGGPLPAPNPPPVPAPVPKTNEVGRATVTVVPAPAVPPPKPGVPAVAPGRRPNPTAAQQRVAWERRTKERTATTGAARYVDRLKPIFAAFGVPEELVWVADVESSFNPLARSPVGAAGLFQLMPATAKGLGLTVAPRDEREHPEKSARAAAAYLRTLYARFRDWRLALAAYNAGEGRVSRLMEQHRAKTFDDLSPHLPAETQMYVPKIEAVIRQREGKRLEDLTVE